MGAVQGFEGRRVLLLKEAFLPFWIFFMSVAVSVAGWTKDRLQR